MAASAHRSPTASNPEQSIPSVETPEISPGTAQKLLLLQHQLLELETLMVAYSGGVDSAFLAATAHRVLGSRMLAVLADSPSLARRDLDQARAFAQSIGMPLHIVNKIGRAHV